MSPSGARNDGISERAAQIEPSATLAISAEASFVARSLDIDQKHLIATIERAAQHKGTSFIEVYQNCNVFNDGAFMEFADKAVRSDRTLRLEHGQPMLFGKEREKGIRLNGATPEIVEIGNGVSESDLWVHDETREDPVAAFILSRMHWPDFPEPMGVIRSVERPTYEALVQQQVDEAIERQGEGNLDTLFMEGDTWTVE